jgi:hypothetical protein
MAKRADWSRKLPRPLVILDNGKEFLRLSTLEDVRTLIRRIPKDRRTAQTWVIVSRRLDDAAVGRGSGDDVLIALQMAFQLERIEYR